MKCKESTVNLMVTLCVCVTFITCYIVRSKNPLFAELNTLIEADSLVSLLSLSLLCLCYGIGVSLILALQFRHCLLFLGLSPAAAATLVNAPVGGH